MSSSSFGALLESLRLRLYVFGRARCGAWWNYRKVDSPFTRLLHVVDGEAFVTVGGMRHTLSQGTLFIAPPFVPVDYLCQGSFDHYYAIFTARVGVGAELFSLMDGPLLLPSGRKVSSQCARLLQLNKGRSLRVYDPDALSYNDAIWKASPQGMSPAAAVETDGILRILLAPFLEDASPKPAWSGEEGARLAKVFEHIEGNLCGSLSLEELAELVNLHPTYFSDYFHKVTGMRPMRHVILKRMERARLLLLTTDMGMKEIAAECGFADVNYFLRSFKRETGGTPRAYRLQTHHP